MTILRAPMPYVGGKSMIADTVWKALGGVTTYVEPFAGSCAVLLARPQPFTGLEIINDANGYVCVAPETRILMRDLTWKHAGDLHEGDDLLAFDEENPGTARPGLMAPEGYRKWRFSKVLAAPKVQLPCYRLTFDDGTVVVASEDHCWLAGSHKSGATGGRGWRWMKTKNMVAGAAQKSWVLKLVPVTNQEISRGAGWLAGIFDGEGDVGANIGISQNQGLVLDQAMSGLRERGFDLSTDTTKKCVRLKVLGGLKEKFRLMMTLRPERLIQNFLAQVEDNSIYARDHQAVGLVSKEYLGVQEVVALATTTKTFVAEGLASHNCNAWRAIQQHPAQVADHANHPPNECVPTGTLIDTPNGPVPVERIIPGMVVWGEKNGRVVPTVVRATQSSEARDFTKIGALRVTGNHPVKTQEHGYIPATDLRPGMSVWKLTYPTLEYVLGVLHSDHGQAMDDLRAGGPQDGGHPVRRGDFQGESETQRAHVESGNRGAYAPGLLDQVSHHDGAPTHPQGTGTGGRGGVAGPREVLDLGTPSDGGSGQPHGRRGGVPGVCPNSRASCQVVCNAEGGAVCARTCARNEGEAPHPGGAGEDPRSQYRTEEDRGDPEANVRCGEDPRDGSRPLGTPEACGVCRDGGVLRVSGGSGEIPQGEQVHDLTGNPQRVSLQRESLQVWVMVHNFETDTGNYFAEGVLVHNCDLHARHRWLWERRDQLQGQLESDPDWCDIKVAGWWLWGMANFFTGAFCVREKPNRCKLLCDSNRGITGTTSDPHQWMQELQDRMRRVKVLCGDFKRALTPSVINPNGGNSGVFLDPPYDGGDTRVYGAQNSASIFQETLDWALANASPNVRVVMAGYDTRPMPEGWRELAWKGHGGHGRRKDNKENTNQDRERLWLSPSCLNPESVSQVTSLDELLGI